MPIPARTSAAGTAPYPWRIELHAVNLLRPTSDPWNHRHGSFKVGCRTEQVNKRRQEACACDSRAAGSSTSYDSQQRGLGCVWRSCFAICPASRDKAESPLPPLSAGQAASDANCASLMRCNRRADGFSANRPILPISPGDSGRASFHRAVSFVHAPGLAGRLSKTCIYRRQTLRADHCSE
ncbi:hypothetical protein GGI42DRAFT_290989 [Trichoderma sp. SZMC 28013]